MKVTQLIAALEQEIKNNKDFGELEVVARHYTGLVEAVDTFVVGYLQDDDSFISAHDADEYELIHDEQYPHSNTETINAVIII